MQSLNPTQLQPPSSILKAADVGRVGGAGGEAGTTAPASASTEATSPGDNTQWAT